MSKPIPTQTKKGPTVWYAAVGVEESELIGPFNSPTEIVEFVESKPFLDIANQDPDYPITLFSIIPSYSDALNDETITGYELWSATEWLERDLESLSEEDGD